MVARVEKNESRHRVSPQLTDYETRLMGLGPGG